jgi:metal-sulfur cluster biosynthetic enzyme
MMRAHDAPESRAAAATDDFVRERVLEALGQVIDPEIGLDVITLGLIYDVAVSAATVAVTYTLTTPGCPMATYMRDAIWDAAWRSAGERVVELHLTFEPLWTPERISGSPW